ncbi:Leucine Rich Repeat [Seminavis robusta]|uniref:Leucine Rich Repeat n=1 Tax=Seminavis robusta TaxID=568900 RepID=A0A9N8HNQ3_9STRA|nr:Leucine Rich Repeat [Seminavis robusta]|eukprot:Sro1104_g241810.1 Leucine Rich Repeat (537) ;mRNA; f:16207-17817
MSKANIPIAAGQCPTGTIEYHKSLEEEKSEKKEPKQQGLGVSKKSVLVAKNSSTQDQTHDVVPDEPSIVSQIQPLPLLTYNANISNMSRFPGAYSVVGIGATAETMDESQNYNNIETGNPCISNETEAVIDGAVVVDDEEINQDRLENGTLHAPDDEVIEGRVMPSNHRTKSRLPLLCLAFVAIAGLGVFLAVYLPFTAKGDASKATFPTSESINDHASMVIHPPFQDDLSLQTLKAFQNTTTPEYKANVWMWNDPNLNSYTPERQLQRYDLAWWYYISNGDNWYRNDHWLSYDVNECDWFTQAHNETILHYDNYPVCDENNTLLILNLNSNNLQGTLPVVNRFLSRMKTFDIGDNNNMHGAVPTGPAGNNEVLEVFIVSNNNFEGQIISGNGFKPFGLRVIKIDSNTLHGYHAPLYHVLTKLEVINIGGNLFRGAQTEAIGNCKPLREYVVSGNVFSGAIPTRLGELAALNTIDVHDNADLTGQIPSELGELSSLSFLDVTGTNISGPVPEKLCDRAQQGLMEIRANCSLVDCCF